MMLKSLRWPSVSTVPHLQIQPSADYKHSTQSIGGWLRLVESTGVELADTGDPLYLEIWGQCHKQCKVQGVEGSHTHEVSNPSSITFRYETLDKLFNLPKFRWVEKEDNDADLIDSLWGYRRIMWVPCIRTSFLPLHNDRIGELVS